MNDIRVSTIGHWNHPIDRFAELLKQHEIESRTVSNHHQLIGEDRQP
jgi:hypothetical protein